MEKDLLSKTDLMKYLSLSRGTIDRLMKHGLPYIKLDRRVLFRKSDIDKWLESKKVIKK
jgi:excisionase family DNA binding protein